MRTSDIPGHQNTIHVRQPNINGKTIPSFQFDTMNERINFIQNTTIEFKLNKNTFITDTRELSKNLLESICRLSIPPKKTGTVSDAGIMQHTEESLNKGIKEWRQQEKITFISAFINRTIDQTCRENHVKIGKNEKENLFNEIKDRYFSKTELNAGCAQSSIIQALLNDKSLAKEIEALDIDKAVPDEITEIMHSRIQGMIKTSSDHPLSIEERQKQQKDLSEINRQYNAALSGERTAIRADIYNHIAENIFNTFLCDKFYGGNSGAVEFNKLREIISEMTLSRAEPIRETDRFFFPEHSLSVTTRLPDRN